MSTTGINGKTIQAAAKAAEDGLAKETSFMDGGRDGITGFCIRVKGKSADWYVRVKGHKISIAELSAFGEADISALRELATSIKGAWKAGRTNEDCRVIINEFLAQHGKRSVSKASNKAAVVLDGAWRWEDLRDAYLEHMRPQISTTHYNNLRSHLGAIPGSVYEADYKDICGEALNNITLFDLREVRNNVLRRGGMIGNVPKKKIRAAELTQSALVNCFAWGFSEHELSGLKSNPAIGFPDIPRAKAKKEDVEVQDDDTDDDIDEVLFDRPHMSLKQIHDFLWLWLPKQKFLPEAKLALTLQGLTGQRIETITSSFIREYRRIHLELARFIWALGPDKMGAYRVLPMPDWASYTIYAALQQRKARGVKSKRATTDLSRNLFLFPQTRVRRKGDSAKRHISNKNINNIFAAARKPGGPLAGTTFASHDLRRAFVTHMATRGKEMGLATDNPEDALELLKKITHKNEGKVSVISKHYNLGSQDRIKLRILTIWQDLILGAYGEHRRPDPEVFDLDEDAMLDMTPDEVQAWFEEQREMEEETPRSKQYA